MPVFLSVFLFFKTCFSVCLCACYIVFQNVEFKQVLNKFKLFFKTWFFTFYYRFSKRDFYHGFIFFLSFFKTWFFRIRLFLFFKTWFFLCLVSSVLLFFKTFCKFQLTISRFPKRDFFCCAACYVSCA